MKKQRHKIFGCLVLIFAIVVSLATISANNNQDFGKTITTDQMANMFGGGWVWCGDTDCDTTSGSCPGGDTCGPDDHDIDCQKCKSGNGDICGTPGGMGWMCVNGTASCDDGSKGKCVKTAGQPATCQKNVMAGTPPSCGTRPDC